MPDPGPRRRRAIALILSGMFPGLGQFDNRQHVKGGLFLIAATVLSWFLGRATPANPLALVQPGAALILSFVALLGLWLWSVIDAWRVAGREWPECRLCS